MEQTCQGCGRHCPLSALSCERGRRLNGQKTTENAQPKSYENANENFNKHGGHREYSAEEFAALSTDEKILVRLKGLGHALHFSDQFAGQLLSNLTDEEKSTLLKLLTKLS